MLDLIIIGIIVLCGIVGMRVGFIRTIYQLLASIVAFIGAIVLAPIVEQAIKMTPIYEMLKEWISRRVPQIDPNIGLQAQGDVIEEVTKWLPDFLTEQLVANNNLEVYGMLGVTKLIDYIILSLTHICITGIAIIVTWLVIRLVLSIGVSILDLVSKLPLLKTANQLAGGLAGVVKGLVGVWIVCILVPVLTLHPDLGFIQSMLDQSVFTKVLYENNLLLQIGLEYLMR